jgi:uncharacterized circularly permuted ATP-grasp superfamily protein
MQPFLDAYRDGLAVFVNSFRCRLSEDKAFFAILTDESFASLMTAEESQLVRRIVPWTRRVAERKTRRGGSEIDLVPYVIDRQAELVLKPAHGYGGRSVLVGDERRSRGRPRCRTACASPGSSRSGSTSRRRCSRCWRTTARSSWRLSR